MGTHDRAEFNHNASYLSQASGALDQFQKDAGFPCLFAIKPYAPLSLK